MHFLMPIRTRPDVAVRLSPTVLSHSRVFTYKFHSLLQVIRGLSAFNQSVRFLWLKSSSVIDHLNAMIYVYDLMKSAEPSTPMVFLVLDHESINRDLLEEHALVPILLLSTHKTGGATTTRLTSGAEHASLTGGTEHDSHRCQDLGARVM